MAENNIREIKPKPDEEIIKKLEELLEQAKTGEIQYLVYIVDRKNSFSTGIYGWYREEQKIIGMMEVMKFDFLKKIVWDDTT